MTQTKKKPSEIEGQELGNKKDFKAPAPEDIAEEIPSPAEELEQSVLEIYQAIEREADPKNKAYGHIEESCSQIPSESQIKA